jgi:hypothetical protein
MDVGVLAPLCSAFASLEAAFHGTPLQGVFEALLAGACVGTTG